MEGACCQRLLAAGRSCRLVLDTDGRGEESRGSGNTGLVLGKEEPDSRRCSATAAGPGQQQHATKQTKSSAVSDMPTGCDNIASPPPPLPPLLGNPRHHDVFSGDEYYNTALIRQRVHAGHGPHGRRRRFTPFWAERRPGAYKTQLTRCRRRRRRRV